MRQCPKGHDLPHVRADGSRCSPLDCVEAEAEARTLAPAAAVATRQDVAAEVVAELTMMKQAWDSLHPLPKLAEPEVRPNHPDYVAKRIKQVAPLALERRIRRAVHDPSLNGEEAASELLDRAGYTRKPEGDVNFNGPVLVVGLKPSDLPWSKKELVEGEVVKGDDDE